MKKSFFYLAFAISLTACTENSVLEIEELQPMPEKEQTANEKAINTYIAKKRPATRSSETTVEPYIVDGDTLMYVADYGDGWEVFSNDTRFPMVIMRSETGKFNINEIAFVDPLCEIFENTIGDLKSLKNSSECTINDSWKQYGVRPQFDDDDKRDEEDEEFTEIEFQGPSKYKVTEYYPKGGRLKTHWGQRESYNMFTKFCYEGSETHMCPVGCGAVAVGQYLYWSHYEHGIPVNTVNDASYDQATNTFSFSGNTPDFWDLMMSDTNPVPYDIPYMMRPTAIFLGFIGKEIKIKYGCNGSESIPANEMAALKKHLSTPFIEKDCSSDIVLSILSQQYPVYCMGKEDGSKNRGHVFIIDYCRHEYSMSTIYYVTVPCEAGGDVSEEIPDFGDSVTYEELSEYYDQIRQEVSTSRDNFIKINWGWNGKDNNVEYNLDAISWKGDGTDYNRRKIFYPSNINLN